MGPVFQRVLSLVVRVLAGKVSVGRLVLDAETAETRFLRMPSNRIDLVYRSLIMTLNQL